jgi:predicted phage terminase large subunit-like protein
MTTATAEPMTEIRPQPKQEAFLASSADIAIFGGGAGGGKTWALLMEALRHTRNPRFGAVIFRRTYPQIERQGGMWDESSALYPYVGGTPNRSDMLWKFPGGAKVSFAHLQHADDIESWKGAQITLLAFDQLEEFPERAFFYLLSRNRSMSGIRPYMRATVNPDPDSWVATFISWWIDQDTGLPIQSRAGVLRWFVRVGEKLVWGDSPEELVDREGVEPTQPKSVTFIPATLEDNPILMQKDPGYKANLQAQDYVDQQRLLGGNWKVRAAAGKVFAREWFKIVPQAPAGGEEGTGWDFAATEKKGKGDDPDYTARVTMRYVRGRFYILDFEMVRVGPAELDSLMMNVTIQRAALAKKAGANYRVRWEREPGSAGKRDNIHIVQLLSGYDGRGVRPQGDKVVRAKPLAAASFAGNVELVEGEWNEAFLRHYHSFPDGAHDDGVDAGSVIYNDLALYTWGSGEQEDDKQEAA